MSGDAIEFGCGYGTFTIVAAQRILGTVYALDIDPLMVTATAARVSQAGLKNVVVEQRDFVAQGCGRNAESASLALLFNILHIEDPVGLLRKAHRVIRRGGLVGIIHWNYDVRTPRGPPLNIRPRPEQCRARRMKPFACMSFPETADTWELNLCSHYSFPELQKFQRDLLHKTGAGAADDPDMPKAIGCANQTQMKPASE